MVMTENHIHPKKFCGRFFRKPKLAGLILLEFMLLFSLFFFETKAGFTQVLTVGSAVAAIGFSVCILLRLLAGYRVQQTRLKLLQNDLVCKTKNISLLESQCRTQGRKTHDYNNQLNMLSGLVKSEQYAQALAYLREIQQEQTEASLYADACHPVINAVLNQKAITAQQKRIDFQLQINDLSRMHIRATDCGLVLSNLLDNAIEACCKLPESARWIHTRLLLIPASNHSSSYLFLSVRNPSLPPKNDVPLHTTTKSDPVLHGHGLPACKSIVTRYGAEYCFAWEDNVFTAVIDWPDKLPEG